MVVDDEPGIRTALRANFLRHGWRVETASCVREAVRNLEGKEFDLVVTDYNMPGMSGLDVAREVRLMRANLPVAVASGFVDQALRDQAHGAGVWELVLKAAAVEDLCEIFARLAQSAGKKPGAL